MRTPEGIAQSLLHAPEIKRSSDGAQLPGLSPGDLTVELPAELGDDTDETEPPGSVDFLLDPDEHDSTAADETADEDLPIGELINIEETGNRDEQIDDTPAGLHWVPQISESQNDDDDRQGIEGERVDLGLGVFLDHLPGDDDSTLPAASDQHGSLDEHVLPEIDDDGEPEDGPEKFSDELPPDQEP